MIKINEIQLFKEEIQLILRIIKRKAPSNLLVFGLGNDSVLWHQANKAGKTIFLEDDTKSFLNVTEKSSKINAYLINYQTQRKDFQKYIDSPELLELDLPDFVRNTKWDVILVDGPKGWLDEQPGRMKSIYEALRLSNDDAHIFIHDIDRKVEQMFCDHFFTNNKIVEEVKLLRHYHIS